MKVTIKDGWVTVQMPIEEGRISTSGKSVLLCTTGGTKETETEYKGEKVSVNANITIPNRNRSTASAATPAPAA